jgi:phosphotransferase system  glucose/maltose/N-acetylglucosamine-specific IIC component
VSSHFWVSLKIEVAAGVQSRVYAVINRSLLPEVVHGPFVAIYITNWPVHMGLVTSRTEGLVVVLPRDEVQPVL